MDASVDGFEVSGLETGGGPGIGNAGFGVEGTAAGIGCAGVAVSFLGTGLSARGALAAAGGGLLLGSAVRALEPAVAPWALASLSSPSSTSAIDRLLGGGLRVSVSESQINLRECCCWLELTWSAVEV